MAAHRIARKGTPGCCLVATLVFALPGAIVLAGMHLVQAWLVHATGPVPSDEGGAFGFFSYLVLAMGAAVAALPALVFFFSREDILIDPEKGDILHWKGGLFFPLKRQIHSFDDVKSIGIRPIARGARQRRDGQFTAFLKMSWGGELALTSPSPEEETRAEAAAISALLQKDVVDFPFDPNV